jgi:hypothetical protein
VAPWLLAVEFAQVGKEDFAHGIPPLIRIIGHFVSTVCIHIRRQVVLFSGNSRRTGLAQPPNVPQLPCGMLQIGLLALGTQTLDLLPQVGMLRIGLQCPLGGRQRLPRRKQLDLPLYPRELSRRAIR